jgi:hypothetical protein
LIFLVLAWPPKIGKNRNLTGSMSLLFTYSLSAGDCPTGWLNGGDIGGCYLFVVSSNGVTYNEAITICESNGGFLTDILNQETQDLLANFGRSQNYQDLVWTIGGNDFANVSSQK